MYRAAASWANAGLSHGGGSWDRCWASYDEANNGRLVAGTRWQPHRVFCTHRPGGRRGAAYVVKYRRPDAASAAALISEVVCHALLRRLGIRTLSAVLVHVTPAFIRACGEKDLLEYEIMGGASPCSRRRTVAGIVAAPRSATWWTPHAR